MALKMNMNNVLPFSPDHSRGDCEYYKKSIFLTETLLPKEGDNSVKYSSGRAAYLAFCNSLKEAFDLDRDEFNLNNAKQRVTRNTGDFRIDRKLTNDRA